jgi:Polyketide cyclase / dehydrase and lipid transport
MRTAMFFAALALLSMSGCAALPEVGSAQNRLPANESTGDQIHWPEQYEPRNASFVVRNQIDIRATPQTVWDILIRAEAWPTWYQGAQNVRVLGAGAGILAADSTFTWKTMGLNFTSDVKEFRPPLRVSWESRKRSIQGYHAWLIIPTAEGCRVITEETQHGFLTAMQKVFVPNKLHRLHDIWLANIKTLAETSAQGRP